MKPPHDTDNEIQTRLESAKPNLEWLIEHDLESNRHEAIKRLGYVIGNLEAVKREWLGND